jgi:hypothetical protein
MLHSGGIFAQCKIFYMTRLSAALCRGSVRVKPPLKLKSEFIMLGKVFAFAAAAAMVCGPALAADAGVAQLGAVSGSVMVSTAGKTAPATAGVLKAGDRVVASANGKASVKFADGCVVNLKPASMITVAAKSPCASGAGLVNAQSAQPAQAWASGTAVAVGAFVVVGGVLVAVGANDNDKSNSVSP